MRVRMLLTTTSLLLAAQAWAVGFDAERFAPAAGAAGGLQIERPAVPAHLEYSLGVFASFADDAVVARDDGGEVARPLHRAVGTDLLASVGLFGQSEVAIDLPLRIFGSGDETPVPGGTLNGSRGIGDLRIVAKATLDRIGSGELGALFGAAAVITLPTGDPAALRGAGDTSLEPRLLAQLGGASWAV